MILAMQFFAGLRLRLPHCSSKVSPLLSPSMSEPPRGLQAHMIQMEEAFLSSGLQGEGRGACLLHGGVLPLPPLRSPLGCKNESFQDVWGCLTF